MEKLRELEGYEDVLDIIKDMHGPEELVKNLTPEQRLAGLGPEERLQLLRYLGELAEAEGKLPAAVLEALRKATNGTP